MLTVQYDAHESLFKRGVWPLKTRSYIKFQIYFSDPTGLLILTS